MDVLLPDEQRSSANLRVQPGHGRDVEFISSINWPVVWEQWGSNRSSQTRSYQVAAPLQCISLNQNLHLRVGRS